MAAGTLTGTTGDGVGASGIIGAGTPAGTDMGIAGANGWFTG